MTALLRYDAARQALAEARSIDEVRDWEDKAAAVREYARRARNREMEIDAAEIRVRAQRRRGELLREMRASGMLAEGRKKLSSADDSLQRVTLAELDTSRDESSRSQKLAAIAPDAFERLAARVRKRMEDNPDDHSFDVLRERDGPINGARSVMGSRQEPDDSLDYFPTPPHATRALFERVFPAIGIRRFGTIWEPACGEGHIAEVAREYVGSDNVVASDVFDYGYGTIGDFLDPSIAPAWVNWIITNPPFGDNAIAFVKRAFDVAGDGVAMFFRSQWAVEGIERYEQIFRDNPPSLCAFFVERINLCKGRWDPDGTTATAYCWLIWVQGLEPQPPFWIPPGCREALTKPDDRERFTAHPVVKLNHLPPLPFHDPETGEIIETSSQGSDASSAAADRNPVSAVRSDSRSDPEGGRVNAGDGLVSEPSESASEPAARDAGPPSNVIPHPREIRFGDDEYEDGLDIPAFLKRGHPDCIVKS